MATAEQSVVTHICRMPEWPSEGTPLPQAISRATHMPSTTPSLFVSTYQKMPRKPFVFSSSAHFPTRKGNRHSQGCAHHSLLSHQTVPNPHRAVKEQREGRNSALACCPGIGPCSSNAVGLGANHSAHQLPPGMTVFSQAMHLEENSLQ